LRLAIESGDAVADMAMLLCRSPDEVIKRGAELDLCWAANRGGLFASAELFDGERTKLGGTDDTTLHQFNDLLGHHSGCHIVGVAETHSLACSLKSDAHLGDRFRLESSAGEKRSDGHEFTLARII
jgi:hypothetical protein